MSNKFPSNVIKYAIILVIAGQFGRELQMINYGSVLTKIPEITASQTDIIKAVSFILPLLLVYFGGIFADKYGRRLTWAILLVLYGAGMLWLNTATSLGTASFGFAFIAAILISGALALGRAPLAWLFDHEGKDGLKNAYGLYHALIMLIALIGIGLRMVETVSTNWNYIFAGSSILAIIASVWVITFPENYGNRSSPWVRIAKSGVNQFLSGRVLQLLALQGIVMLFASFAKIALLFNVGLEPTSSATDIDTYLTIKSVITAFLAAVLLLLVKMDYKRLLVYPMIFTAIFYALLPFAPLPVFFILESGITLFLFLKMVGVLMLANEVIVENRATTLSLLALLISIFVFLIPLWGPFFYELGIGMLSLVACACTVISLGLLVAALKIHES